MRVHMKVCWCAVAGLLALTSTIAQAQAPAAATEEVRHYKVLVKQKSTGNVTIRVTDYPDGTTICDTVTAVQAEFLLIKYRYDYHGQETWRNDRFLSLESRTNDDGKAISVSASTDARGSRISLKNRAAGQGPPLAMTSNYWRLPDARLTNDRFSIIDSDTGSLFTVRLARVGRETIAVAGRAVACDHYRVSGDTAADVWFDARDRLVRQQTVEQGYPTELRLVHVEQGAARR